MLVDYLQCYCSDNKPLTQGGREIHYMTDALMLINVIMKIRFWVVRISSKSHYLVSFILYIILTFHFTFS